MTASPSAVASSGAVIGIMFGIMLFFLDIVDATDMIILAIVLAIALGVIVGIPAAIMKRKIADARREQAAQAPPPSAPQYYPPVAAAAVPGAPPPQPSAPAPRAMWPLNEPLCVIETGQEREVLLLAASAGIPADRLLVFLTQTSENMLPSFGLVGVETVRLSRVEGEDVVSPGDLEKLGYIIERHFSKGQRYNVVLPSVESLVEAAGVKNVRRLLDVARELAQSATGSVLFSLDPRALSPDKVAIIERGSFKVSGTLT